jgi:hypothetical protein
MSPFALPRTISDPAALEAAAAAVQSFFADKKMPLIVAGRRVRCEHDFGSKQMLYSCSSSQLACK